MKQFGQSQTAEGEAGEEGTDETEANGVDGKDADCFSDCQENILAE